MHVLITGASGLIGQHLSRALIAQGHTITALSRSPKKPEPSITWKIGKLEDPTFLAEALQGVDAVVNLAGASVAQRWTDSVRQEIVASRVQTTSALCQAMAQMQKRPRVLLNASAIGFYGTHPSTTFDEQSPQGEGFLAEVCQKWEAAAHGAEALGVRTVLIRIGIVLAREGGALPPLSLPVKTFVGGTVGDGKQWMSWIHIDDIVGLMLLALEKDAAKGPINGVAPKPVRGAEMMRAVGRALRRPVWLPVPGFALKLMFGEMADDVLLHGQHVMPKAAQALGYTYRFTDLDAALQDLLGPKS